MANHELVDLGFPDKAGTYTAWATVENYPGWLVELEVRLTGTNPVVSQLRVYPHQEHPRPPRPRLPERPTLADVKKAADQSRWSTDSADVPAGGIPARLIRSINVGELLTLAQFEAERRGFRLHKAAESWFGKDPEFADYLARIAKTDMKMTVKRPGQAGYGVDHYLLWTTRFLDKCAEPGMRKPYPALARQYKKSERWIRDTVVDANRRHGLWKPYGQGRVGGELTQLGRELLAERAEAANA
jgi:hypothetical protein